MKEIVGLKLNLFACKICPSQKVLENIAPDTTKHSERYFNPAFLTMEFTFFLKKLHQYEKVAGHSHFENVGWNQKKYYGRFHLLTQTCTLGPELLTTLTNLGFKAID